MRENVWLWNHYAANQFFDRGGRQYQFARFLKEAGYEPTVFCASTVHNSDRVVEVKGAYRVETVDGLPFVFVKAPPYRGNGAARVRNMLAFRMRIRAVAREIAKRQRPDAIVGSSAHPLTAEAAIRTAREFGVPAIAEIRDLWPLSIVEYMGLSERNPMIQALYRLERWIYEEANGLVFVPTLADRYIRDRGWDKTVDLSKILCLPNGVDLVAFDKDVEEHPVSDPELLDEGTFKAVYAGSVRKVNNLGVLVGTAEELAKMALPRPIKILVYGDGDERAGLEAMAKEKSLANIVFKGRVGKHEVPAILRTADASVYHGKDASLVLRYGVGSNRVPEYLAAGRPVMTTVNPPNEPICAHGCGLAVNPPTPVGIAQALVRLAALPGEEREHMGQNARKLAKEYDFRSLTAKLAGLIENAWLNLMERAA